MDLGIAGRRALVCASSRGLGRACAMALAAEGVDVVVNGRDEGTVAATAAEINAAGGGRARGVVADLTREAGRQALLAALPDPDILVTNCGGPAPARIADVRPEALREALEANMVAPLLLARAVLPAMIARGWGRIINITSAMVTTPRAHMPISAGPRAGLTAAMKAISQDVAVHGVTVNNLLPERIDTDRQRYMAERTAEREGISVEEARAAQVRSISARRLGRPEELGAVCAFVASIHAGYMSGQNFRLDGGSYAGLV